MFPTVSFHIVKPCNMACKFCYATFNDMDVKQLPYVEACDIILKLKKAGMEKITFAGGEPMLYKMLPQVIMFSKSLGLTTSIITNGSLLTDAWLQEMRPYLDWVGLSVDSLDVNTNASTGRIGVQGFSNHYGYHQLITMIHAYGYKLKINTVVNAYNKGEDMNDFIWWARPERWKVFQALRVNGQNDKQFEEIKVSEKDYDEFIWRHRKCQNLVPENNAYMTGSYLLVDPQGRLFENSKGFHTYSQPLHSSTVEECLKQLELNVTMFHLRGGIYKW